MVPKGCSASCLRSLTFSGLGRHPGLHGFQQVFVDPAGDSAAALVARALGSQRTASAGWRGKVANVAPELRRLPALAAGQGKRKVRVSPAGQR